MTRKGKKFDPLPLGARLSITPASHLEDECFMMILEGGSIASWVLEGGGSIARSWVLDSGIIAMPLLPPSRNKEVGKEVPALLLLPSAGGSGGGDGSCCKGTKQLVSHLLKKDSTPNGSKPARSTLNTHIGVSFNY
jgi:hypothetical protein